MMKIDFEFQTDHGVFRDALHLPDNHGLTDEQIEAVKQQRLTNWLAFLTAESADPNVVDVVARVVPEA